MSGFQNGEPPPLRLTFARITRCHLKARLMISSAHSIQ
jgi:hypothetical protein